MTEDAASITPSRSDQPLRKGVPLSVFRLLSFEAQRTVPCSCGRSAHYKELRAKTILTVVGPVRISRPYYLCPQCSVGQCPADDDLGIADLESSPGVRRMEAVVGSEMPFAKACEPMKVLAGLEVPAKAIERAAEAIGTEIARRDDREIARAKQLVLPVVSRQNEAENFGYDPASS